MSFHNPVSDSEGPRAHPTPSFPEALKKLHNRCEFLYSRIENAAQEAIHALPDGIDKTAYQNLWAQNLMYLKDTESGIFADISWEGGVRHLRDICTAFEEELERRANELPEKYRPDLSPGKNNPRTLAVLAQETFQAGEKLSKEELQQAYRDEFISSNTIPEIPKLPVEIISKRLYYRDIGRLETASKSTQNLARNLRKQQIKVQFGEDAPPIGEVIGSYNWNDIVQFLIKLSSKDAAQIKCLNFDHVQYPLERKRIKHQIPHIISLFPNAFKIQFGEHPLLPLFNTKKVMQALLEKEQITQLDMRIAEDDLPANSFLWKLVGFALCVRSIEELQVKVEILTAHAKNLKHLKIVTTLNRININFPPSITSLNLDACHHLNRIEHLPDSLKILSCKRISLEHLPPLPPKLEELDCDGCYHLEGLPELPDSLIKLNCYITDRPVVLRNPPPDLKGHGWIRAEE